MTILFQQNVSTDTQVPESTGLNSVRQANIPSVEGEVTVGRDPAKPASGGTQIWLTACALPLLRRLKGDKYTSS